ncbi:MAG: hypothetical protein ACYCTI_01735 [Acidimicrobiales bacterium]
MEVTMDQVLMVWTTCEATVEERWVLRVSPAVSFDDSGGSILDQLDTDAVQVLAVENLDVHSERERRVIRVELAPRDALADTASEPSSPAWMVPASATDCLPGGRADSTH